MMNLLLVDDDDIALLHYRKMADSSGLFSAIRVTMNISGTIDLRYKWEVNESGQYTRRIRLQSLANE